MLKGIRNRQSYYAVEFYSLFLCCLLSSFKVSSIIAFLIYLIYIVIIVLEDPRFVLKYLFFFFGILANIMGCLICEFCSIFLIELSVDSHYVGALPTLILAQSVFLTCIYEGDKTYVNKHNKAAVIKKFNGNTLFILNCFVFLLYILMFVHIYPYSALRLQVDRMTYSSLGYNDGIWNYLSKWAQFFIVIPIGCTAFTTKKRYKVFGIITIIIYCLYYLWVGNKFGSFFTLFCVFCMVDFSRMEIKEKTLKKIFLITIGLMFGIILGAAFVFTKIQNQGTGISMYLQTRLAEQGQLFWKTYEVGEGKIHFSEIGNEVQGQFSRAINAEDLVGAEYGIYHIMYLCAPKQKVDSFILYGSRYTEAGYASAFYYFGILGCMIFAIIIAQLVVYVTNSVISSTKNNSLLGMIFMTRMFFITATAMSMFLFRDYFTGTSIITYLWILFSKGIKKITFKDGVRKLFSIRI